MKGSKRARGRDRRDGQTDRGMSICTSFVNKIHSFYFIFTTVIYIVFENTFMPISNEYTIIYKALSNISTQIKSQVC